ncbi:nucleotide exchange factor GrpE [Gloeothece verrucosa]|uniref:Nucleotide exchange factor GrpE n=1 Tax=Gloeothece verrucosa (strain PCC 7822) TaxID=497965 RepID=E0UB83_GLOV7|nr:nucleotide exchange factor GrpE [Gloeothece verrucosa]ADN16328.1 conserved hypothetical protein [Gloeothece verrucosa PCC 7822]
MIPFSLFKEKKQAEELALQVEALVRNLSGLPPAQSDDKNIIDVLESVGLLLKRFQENPELLKQKKTPTPEPEPVQTPPIEDPPTQQESPPVIEIVREVEAQPSQTVYALIRLRDWVLGSKSEDQQEKLNPKVLEIIYNELAQILENEGVICLEEVGKFNYEHQQAVSTETTNDPEKKDLICDTVRPGYLFQDKLIRPQEVIVYTFTNS